MTENKIFDIAIIGGGCGGLAASQYAGRAALLTCIIEDVAIGGQALNIHSLENYPAVFPAKSGFEFIEILKEQVSSFGVTFLSATVDSITKINGAFELLLNDKSIVSARAVIIASGARPKELGIAGEKELRGRGVSYCAICDGPFFRNKKIFVVGGGDSACDEARYLSRISPAVNGKANVIMLVRRDKLRAQKLNALRVLNDENIEIRFNTQIKKIQGLDMVSSLVLKNNTTNSEYTEAADAVFIFAGLNPCSAISCSENIQKDAGGFIITNDKMETSAPGIFAVGDVRNSPLRQVVTAVSDGAIAAHSAGEYLENENAKS